MAVNIQNVSFSYDKLSKLILNKVNIVIPKNSIFALLGPSGCGKTTLFKVIMGLLKCDDGAVRVFGYSPGTLGSGIPGSGLGYMPQHNALKNDLTINEILIYFGLIYGLRKDTLKIRIDYLVSLLDLPEKSRFIGQLSGGQQRRLSLAISIIHKPRLVILDEPTVGVDPILCNKIWNLFFSLRKNSTILMSTHYVEEARKADLVAFMRKGKILEYQPPAHLLEKYNTNNFETVFVKLAETGRKVSTDCNFRPKKDVLINEKHERKSNYRTTFFALIYKSYLETRRNPIVIFLLFVCSFFTATLMTYALGIRIQNLNVAFVNEDFPFNYTIANSSNGSIPSVANLLRKSLNEQMSISLRNYSSFASAESDLRKGVIYGIVKVGENFSICYVESDPFLNTEAEVDNNTIQCGTIYLYTDPGNKIISATVEFSVYMSILKLQKLVAQFYDLNPKLVKPLIEVRSFDEKLEIDTSDSIDPKNFVGPGGIFMASLMFGILSSLLNTLDEQNCGITVRNYVAGVSGFDIVTSQLLVKTVFMIISNFINLFAGIYVLNIPCNGSVLAILTLLCTTSMVGILQGILQAILIPNILFCFFFLIAMMYQISFVGTVSRSIESQPYYIRWLQYVLPMALPLKSLRNLMVAHNTRFHPIIWPGFVMNTIWIICLFFLCIHCLKMRH